MPGGRPQGLSVSETLPMDASRAPRKRRWGMVADDLTGACDAGVKFANQGFTTIVMVDPMSRFDPRAEVIVVSTGSRGDEAERAGLKVRTCCRNLRDHEVSILFRKIDSTLRGNLRAELDAVMEAGDFDAALVTPSFPEMGRVLRGGMLFPRDINSVCEIHLPTLLPRADGFTVADAETDDDLAGIAAEALHALPRPLLAGSAGLATAVARCLRSGPTKVGRSEDLPGSRGPALFVIGSKHPVTQGQVAQLVSKAAARQVELDGVTTSFVAECLAAGRHLVMRIPFEGDPFRTTFALRPEIFNEAWGGVVMSGGDTATWVCRNAGIKAIELGGEILPGIPWGRPHGSREFPWPVVTKGGSFGTAESLVTVAEFLAAHP